MNSNSNFIPNQSSNDNIKQPISYSFSYSNADANDNVTNSSASYTTVTKKIECDKHFNIYKGNTDDTMVYYCPSSKYDYIMRNQIPSYPKEYSTKISTIIMNELNVHPISFKDISWTQDNNNHYIIQLKQNQQVVSLTTSASLNAKHNNTISDNKMLPMNNIWIVGYSNYLNSTQNKLDLVNKQIERLVYQQQHGRGNYTAHQQKVNDGALIKQDAENIGAQNSKVEIECSSKLLIYGEPVDSISKNSDGNIADISIQNQTGMLLCTHPRFNPYDNFIHDEMHLQKYGINDINGWLKESVVQLDGQVKRYNYQITLKPNNTIKTLELDNAGTTKSQFYFIGEKDNNNIQAINKLQTEQMHKLVNFHNKETKIGNVEIILAIALILLLLITIIGSIIDKIQEKKQKERKAEEKKSYAIKKIK